MIPSLFTKFGVQSPKQSDPQTPLVQQDPNTKKQRTLLIAVGGGVLALLTVVYLATRKRKK